MARKEKLLVIHCSDSRFGNACLIDSWHRTRGWSGIGYHWVICNGKIASGDSYSALYDGLLESGRTYNRVGAHVKGYNEDSIGVCLICESGIFTEKQFETLRKVIDIHKYHKVVFHSDLDPMKPKCPGLTMNDLVRKV